MNKRIIQQKRAIKAILLVLLLSVVGMTKMYADVTIGNLNYSLNSSTLTATVTGHKDGTSATGNLIIPSSVTYGGQTYSVTSIGSYAFYNCSGFTGSLTIPNSVTTIGSSAFRNCSGFTGTLTIPNSVTVIGDGVFENCSGFTGSLVIPNSVTFLSGFRGCTGFTGELIIPNSVTTIGTNAFRGCIGLTGSLTIPSSVTMVGNGAFCDCSGFTGSLTIPNSVTIIDNWAFGNCSGFTGNLTIPNFVTTIGYAAFRCCSGFTGDLVIPNSVTSIGGSAFYECSGFTGSLTIGNSLTEIREEAFFGCSGFTGNLTIPNSATTIGNEAFFGCIGFTGSLTIGNSVTSIGNSAFCDCSGFSGNLTIPNSVSTIGNSAFDYCTGLASVTIGNSITSIGIYAFGDCIGLRSIYILPETPPVLGRNVFYEVSPFIPVYVPCNAVEAYQNASGLSGFTNLIGLCSGEVAVMINPSDGGTVIGAGNYSGGDICVLTATPNPGFVFENWTENGIVVSEDPVYSFYAHPTTMVANFSSNNPITFADANVKALCVANWDTNGDGELSYTEAAAVSDLGEVFKFNSTITSFNELQYFIGLTSIGDYAFYNCYNLTSIEIPSSVTSIDRYAFCGCDGLTSIDLPSYVTSIGSYAFYGCDSLTSIELPNSVTTIGDQAFAWSSLTSIELPNSVTTIYGSAFAHCNGLTLIEIPNSVTSMGTNPFSGCSGLEQIMVASDNAYYDSRENCNAIINTNTNLLVTGCKNTIIPNSVISIGYSAFSQCSGLTLIEIPNSVTSIGYYAFYYTGLTSIEIPNSVTSIGSYAFGDCTGITSSLTIPNSITAIGDYAFSGCIGLRSIYILPETPPALGSNTFHAVSPSISIYVPCDAVGAYQTVNGLSGFTSLIGLCSGEVAVMVNPSGGGTVIGAGNYSGGDICVLTATPTPGFIFENWTENGIVVSEDSVYSFYAHPTTMVANFSSNNPITFADANVKALCVANWDTNGDGELSYTEAAAVTDLGEVFINNSSITSFNELQYFIGLSSVGGSELSMGGFCYCNNLTSIEIPSSVISIGRYAFYQCTSLTSIEIPSYVTSIGFGAFSGCSGLVSIEIPNSVTVINQQAFSHCYGLTSIEIPKSVNYIGVNAFSSCIGLEQITVAPNNTTYDSRENCNAIIETNTNTLISGCKNTIILNSITKIDDYAFFGCSGLTSLEIPNSVTMIGFRVFVGCGGLEQIIVESGNPAYDSRENCNALIETVTNTLLAGCHNTVIPNSVTSIGMEAFYNCRGSMDGLTIPNSVTSIGMAAFFNCSDFTGSLTIGNSVTTIGEQAFCYCSGFTGSLTIPNSVISIGNHAFYGCLGFTGTLTLGNSLETIGEGAFHGGLFLSDGLNFTGSLTIPNSVTSIGEAAFAGCEGFTGNLIIPNSVSSIEYGVFGFCSGFTGSLTIPNSVTTIGDYAFDYCSGLTSIEIPSSVTSIGMYAFCGCSSLTTMTAYPVMPPTLGTNVFELVPTTIPVNVPCGASEAYQGANGWNEFTRIMGMCSGTITVVASPTEGGSVMGGGSYEGGGVTCTLTANANHDYCFLNWTEDGEVVSSDAEYTFTVAGDRSLVANFSFMPPAPVVAEYHPDTNEPNSPYVKVHWAASSFEVQIGEGTSTFGYFPFYTLYNYSISENLFLASELEESGVNTSPMTSLSWYATNAPGYEQQGISIWMANVSDTELTTISHTVSGMTLVYTGTMTPEIGWNEFVFNEGNFVWDGVSNVLIFCQRNNGVWNSTVYWQSQDVGFNASSYRYQDSGPYNVNIANTMNTNTKRPNIIMKGEGATTYNLYRANCDGTTAQLIAENLDDTQYIDETWWQLENDSYKYGVSIADSTNTDIFWSNCIEKQGNMAAQIITLSQGWNWCSFNVEITLEDLQTALVTALGSNASITIKSQTQNCKLTRGVWTGQLTTLDLSRMYNISVDADCEITLEGMAVNPAEHPVTINSGANWIAFPLRESMTITEAFGTFGINGDVIKSQFLNCRNTRGVWTGQLNTLEPGKGYIYNSAAEGTRTFTYPTIAK